MARRSLKTAVPVLFAAGVILAGALIDNRPAIVEVKPSVDNLCSELVDQSLCRAAGALADARANVLGHAPNIPVLPDPTRTPGAINPLVTQATLATTICSSQYVAAQTPTLSWKSTTTRRLVEALYPRANPQDFALDQLVPIALGGAPQDERNLWLQSWGGIESVGKKDALEYLLHRMVCSRQITLETAQQFIARDWIDAYSRAMTPQNLARYDLPPQFAVQQRQQLMPQGSLIAQPQGQEPFALQAEIGPEQSNQTPYLVPAIGTENFR